jgi:hypothetical protein
LVGATNQESGTIDLAAAASGCLVGATNQESGAIDLAAAASGGWVGATKQESGAIDLAAGCWRGTKEIRSRTFPRDRIPLWVR